MKGGVTTATGLLFEVPKALQATSPPEARGRARDDVRMLVADSSGLAHRSIRNLPEILRPGDLLVVNASATIPAALSGRTESGEPVVVHLSTVLPRGDTTTEQALQAHSSQWVVELRLPTPQSSSPSFADRSGVVVRLDGRGVLRIGAASSAAASNAARLWHAQIDTPQELRSWLETYGLPIRYSHVPARWPISAYRTHYATIPGSVEMPSAGRALTRRLLSRLASRGVGLAYVVLHCGVSSIEADEPPYAEWYSVPAMTANAVNETRAHGGRVIAVGTTVVRALESAADEDGSLHPGEGWTDLVVTPERGVTTIDGLLTGWHEPRASHLVMLEAFSGRQVLIDSYRAALDAGYLWHEFGDLHLLLH